LLHFIFFTQPTDSVAVALAHILNRKKETSLEIKMSSSSALVIVRNCLIRYGMHIYIILGNIGLLFNMAIFSQRTHRRNSTSLYILIMSFCAFIGLNISVIPYIYALDSPNSFTPSALYCQLQFYFRHAFNQMMRSFFILACANRYAISSNQLRIRSFGRYQITVRIIPSVILFWLVLSIFPAVLLTAKNGSCVASNSLNGILVSIYLLIVLGIIPLASVTTFCVLLYSNLKKMRRRIQPIVNVNAQINQILRKRDRDMIRMLLIEVITYTITTMPTTAQTMYGLITLGLIKSEQRLQIESFFSFFTGVFLLALNNCLSFWIYFSASRSFRLEFKNLVIKYYKFITRKQMQINERN
jgi:hypothetical protein